MNLPTIAVLCLVLAALGGAFMAFRAFGDRGIPWPVAVGHGALGAAGLVVLLLAVLAGPANALVLTGLVVLVLAALGGFYLLSFHVRGRRHPRAVIVAHAAAAVVGVGLVIAAILIGGAA